MSSPLGRGLGNQEASVSEEGEKLKGSERSQVWWLTPVILDSQEAEI
jgi:hypothetical protein